MTKFRINTSVGAGLYDAITAASSRLGASKGEIIRTSLYQYLSSISLIKEQVHKRRSK
jgi:hypothetical protein